MRDTPSHNVLSFCEVSLNLLKKTISIFPRCMVWIDKSITKVTDWHHEACLVMPNSDHE